MYAVVSFQRIDGARRARPRIYPESLAITAVGAWRTLFKVRAWPARVAGPGRTFSHRIAAVKKRLDAVATRVREEEGPEGCLVLVLEYPMHDGF